MPLSDSVVIHTVPVAPAVRRFAGMAAYIESLLFPFNSGNRNRDVVDEYADDGAGRGGIEVREEKGRRAAIGEVRHVY